MYLPNLEWHEAATVPDACELLGRFGADARLLAGGTDLLVDLKSDRCTIRHLITLVDPTPLRGVVDTGDALRIGAMTSITQLNESPPLRDTYAAIRDATSRMAAPQIRNMATVGGNLASAVPCADLPPILMTLSAEVDLTSRAETRRVPLDTFFTDVRQTARHPDELITAVVVPKPAPGFGAAYARFALRDGNAIAVASVAAGLALDESNMIRDARIVLGAVAPIPKSVPNAADILVGQPAGADVFLRAGESAHRAADPISDVRGSADFRRRIVAVLTVRALETAAHRAKENRS